MVPPRVPLVNEEILLLLLLLPFGIIYAPILRFFPSRCFKPAFRVITVLMSSGS